MNDINIRIAKAKARQWYCAGGDGETLIHIPTNYLKPENALKLMDEIREEYNWQIHCDTEYWVVADWNDDPDINQWNYVAHDKDLPRAICLAWLEIFEEEKK